MLNVLFLLLCSLTRSCAIQNDGCIIDLSTLTIFDFEKSAL